MSTYPPYIMDMIKGRSLEVNEHSAVGQALTSKLEDQNFFLASSLQICESELHIYEMMITFFQCSQKEEIIDAKGL